MEVVLQVLRMARRLRVPLASDGDSDITHEWDSICSSLRAALKS